MYNECKYTKCACIELNLPTKNNDHILKTFEKAIYPLKKLKTLVAKNTAKNVLCKSKITEH